MKICQNSGYYERRSGMKRSLNNNSLTAFPQILLPKADSRR